MAKKLTYTEAMAELEKLVSRIEQNDVDIDELQSLLKEAQALIKYCKEKLYKADTEVKKLLENFDEEED